MPCYHQMLAYRSAKPNENGKHPLTFSAHGAYTDLSVTIPCGDCIGCRLAKAKEWAARMVHEAKCHDENSFVTLTYAPENLPQGGTLVKDHMQNFMKRLRHHIYPEKVRFYGCGEYGRELDRPHYHILLFGYGFTDKLLHSNGTSPDKGVYTSALLSELWPYGFSTCGSFSPASARYVANYSVKKILGPKSESHYKGKLPEFALMSRKPGLGYGYLERFPSDMYPKDFFTINGQKYKVPRYYDKVMEKRAPQYMAQIKQKRIEQARENDEGIVRRAYVENVKKTISDRLERHKTNGPGR